MLRGVAVALLLGLAPSFAYIPYVCPLEFANGIPFDLYGGPLYPAAVVLDYEDEVVAPFWVNVSGDWLVSLRQAATYTGIRDCLLTYQPLCKQQMREEFRKLLRLIFPYLFAPSISYHLAYEVRETQWTSSPLDDPDPKLMLVRRTLLVQCLYWCHAMLLLEPAKRPLMLEACPNPCNRAGVCGGVGDVPGSCRMTGEGFFDHHYQCDCKARHAWSPVIQACEPYNPCQSLQTPACFNEGTLSCSYDPELEEVSCLCKPEYMGEVCSVPSNACEEVLRNPLLPNGGLLAAGNRACNVNNDGNQCLASFDPQLGPIYTCSCAAGLWAGDVALRYDNCLKKVTKCDQIICIKGECVDSPDGNEAVCVCKEGYEGSPMCSHWTGIWSTWSPWGRCSPSCGPERWAVRTRQCLSALQGYGSEDRECIGSGIEFSACALHACAPEEGSIAEKYFGVREQTAQATLVLGAITAAALSLIWKFALFSKIAVSLRRIFLRPRNPL